MPECRPATGEIFLACRSEARSKKEPAILDRSAERFETALQKIHDGLSRPRARRRVDDGGRRIGRIQEKCRRAAQHYVVEVATDDLGAQATAVTGKRWPDSDPERTRPGVHALRSHRTDWDDDTLGRTYTMLTDLEAGFRSRKSELGLRLIFHPKEFRADGHGFLSVIAYQLVQMIRRKLQANGDPRSWNRLCADLEGQQRVTATFRQANGQTLHVRKATRAEPEPRSIYDALGIPHTSGGTRRRTIGKKFSARNVVPDRLSRGAETPIKPCVLEPLVKHGLTTPLPESASTVGPAGRTGPPARGGIRDRRVRHSDATVPLGVRPAASYSMRRVRSDGIGGNRSCIMRCHQRRTRSRVPPGQG